jgi:hypothetical protein
MGKHTDWRKLVGLANHKLAKHNQRIITCLIDAMQFDNILDCASTVDKCFVLSEQDPVNFPKNEKLQFVQLPPSFYGTYYVPKLDWNIDITHDYSCFINRIDPIRQTWFYLLYARGLLDRGLVSFNMQMNPGLDYPGRTPQEVFENYHHQYLSGFDYLFNDIKCQVPYRNFNAQDSVFDISLRSKFSIVLETYFERTDTRCFSEKTLRAIQLPRPWLLFAATKTVQKLRDFGFDVFDDYVDHSYDDFDTSENCVQRQEKILEQAKNLIDLKVNNSILQDWHTRATHNRQLLESWHQQWPSEGEKILKNIVQQLE